MARKKSSGAGDELVFSARVDTSAIEKDLGDLKSITERAFKAAGQMSIDSFKKGLTKGQLVAAVSAEADRAVKEIEKKLGKDFSQQISSNIYANAASIKTPSLVMQAVRSPADVGAIAAAEQRAQEAQKRELAMLKANMQARYAAEDAAIKQQKQLEDKKNREILAADKKRIAEQERAERERNRQNEKLSAERIRQEQKEMEARLSILPRLRYALYDVANSAKALSDNIIQVGTTAITASASYETAFTGVERTAQLTNDKAAAAALKQEFVDLAAQIPLTFQDITGIATLGAQLGIAKDDLVSFTENVAEFASVTNVSAESAATAFGSLGQLLNVPADQFNRLGSAIAFAGINAVATESEIISVATAIGGVAAKAGLSAQYTIGLSTALASLRIPAEQSRGALTRVFQEVNRAASTDPRQLSQFARVMGITADEAKRLAETDMASFFTKFVQSLSTVDATKLTGTLDKLNLSDIRVTNTLARLSQNTDLLASSLNDANSAYQKGTFLADSYTAKADDLASRFQILQNNIQSMFASMGDVVAPAIAMVIDAISAIVKSITNLTKTPIGQFLVGFSALLAGAVATVMSLLSALALFGAGLAAIKTAVSTLAQVGLGGRLTEWLIKLTGVEVQTKKTTVSFMGLTGALRNLNFTNETGIATTAQINAQLALSDLNARKAATGQMLLGQTIAANTKLAWANFQAMSALNKVMLVGGWIGIAITAIGLVAEAWNAVANATKSAEEKNKEYAESYFGTTTGLADAMREDAANFAKGLDSSVIKIPVSIQPEDSESAKKYSEDLSYVIDAQGNLKKATEDATKAIDAQASAYGENAKKALAGLLTASEDFQKFIKPGGALEQLGGDPEAFVKAILGDPQKGAKKYISTLTMAMQQTFREGPQLGVTPSGQPIITSTELGAVAEANDLVRALTGEIQGSADAAANADVINQALAESLVEVGDGADISTGNFEEFKETFNAAFGEIDLINEFYDAMDSLQKSIEDNGTAFDSLSSGGIANMDALRQALFNSISAAEAMGGNAVDGIAYVFAYLQSQGIDTARLLQQVAGMYNISIGVLQAAIDRVPKDAFKGIRTSAGGAAKKVRTLIDYANDLSSVFSRAFEIRFGGQSSLDDITSGWRDMAEATEEARQSIQDLTADIDSLTADRAMTEYFLSVAEAYGDTIRAAELRAKLGKIDADLAKKNKDLAKAQDKTNKTLVGNSDAAIENRANILDMVKAYQEHIKTLAASGMNQAELAAATAQLKNDFYAQATALGYNRNELDLYARGFDDVSVAIGNVPRDITVAFNGNPVLQALNEFAAKSRAAISSAGGNVPVNFPNMFEVFRNAGAEGKRGFRVGFNGALLYYDGSGRFRGSPGDIRFVASGGYISGPGTSTSDSIPARLSDGEYVIRAAAVNKYGVGFFNQLNQMRSPRFASGGLVQSQSAQMVYLSPEDRALLRSVGSTGEVVLYANNEAIARSANSGNRSIVAAGGRP